MKRQGEFQFHKSSLFRRNPLQEKPLPKLENNVKSLHRRFTSRILRVYKKIRSLPETIFPILTNPSDPVHNNGLDNIYYNLIVRENELFLQRYRVEKLLGAGVFGVVYKCYDLLKKTHVAVKVVNSKPEYSEQSKMESSILKQFEHSPYVVKVLNTFTEKSHFFLVLELLSYSLYKLLLINQCKGFRIGLIARLSKHILKGLVEIHKNAIIHTDIKPENIMLTYTSITKFDKRQFLRIIDFSNAMNKSDLNKYFQNMFKESPHRIRNFNFLQARFYRAPEVFLGCGNIITEKIDVWSYGVMIYELFLGRPLFSGYDDFEIISKMVRIMGLPPHWMVRGGRFSYRFFRPDGSLRTEKEFQEIEKREGRGRRRRNPTSSSMNQMDPYLSNASIGFMSLRDRIMSHNPPKPGEIGSGKGANEGQFGGEDSLIQTDVHFMERKLKEEKEKLLLLDFLQRFIVWDPNLRYSCKKALAHQFLEYSREYHEYKPSSSSRNQSDAEKKNPREEKAAATANDSQGREDRVRQGRAGHNPPNRKQVSNPTDKRINRSSPTISRPFNEDKKYSFFDLPPKTKTKTSRFFGSKNQNPSVNFRTSSSLTNLSKAHRNKNQQNGNNGWGERAPVVRKKLTFDIKDVSGNSSKYDTIDRNRRNNRSFDSFLYGDLMIKPKKKKPKQAPQVPGGLSVNTGKGHSEFRRSRSIPVIAQGGSYSETTSEEGDRGRIERKKKKRRYSSWEVRSDNQRMGLPMVSSTNGGVDEENDWTSSSYYSTSSTASSVTRGLGTMVRGFNPSGKVSPSSNYAPRGTGLGGTSPTSILFGIGQGREFNPILGGSGSPVTDSPIFSSKNFEPHRHQPVNQQSNSSFFSEGVIEMMTGKKNIPRRRTEGSGFGS